MLVFKRYMSNAFINTQNLALYSCENCAELRYEFQGLTEAVRRFESAESAESWYYSFPGDGLVRLLNAINSITEGV